MTTPCLICQIRPESPNLLHMCEPCFGAHKAKTAEHVRQLREAIARDQAGVYRTVSHGITSEVYCGPFARAA